MRPHIPLLTLLPFLIPLTSAQAEDTLTCPDSTLTTYLISLIDILYANGLTTFETLLASISSSDSGYALLESWYSDSTFTIFPPTDKAFQSAGIYPPFTGLGEEYLTNLVGLHVVRGDWGYGNLPESPMHGIGVTELGMKGWLNSSVETEARQVMVLQQGDGGSVVGRMTVGNATSWSGPVDLSGSELTNLVVLPVDAVMSFPPAFSEVLTMPTTSRSAKGLNSLKAALASHGGAEQLDGLTKGGFTIFAPVDDAWTGDLVRMGNDSQEGISLLGNHYTTEFSLYSGAWTNSGRYEGLKVESGGMVSVVYNATGSFVTLDNGDSARVLRADVPLQNGVMHIIDTILVGKTTTSGSTATSLSALSPLATSSTPTGASGTVSTSEAASTGNTQSSGSGALVAIDSIRVLVNVMVGLVGVLVLL